MASHPLLVTFLLAEDRPPFRVLAEAELPTVPDPGEPIALNGRTYRVMERSWRLGIEPVQERDAVFESEPPDEPVIRLGVGLLLEQIGGPPHVVVAPGAALQQ